MDISDVNIPRMVQNAIDKKNSTISESSQKVELGSSLKSDINDLQRRLDDFIASYKKLKNKSGELESLGVDFNIIKSELKSSFYSFFS